MRLEGGKGRREKGRLSMLSPDGMDGVECSRLQREEGEEGKDAKKCEAVWRWGGGCGRVK